MSDVPLDITYAVHTATCTFLLDAEGVCLRVVTSTRTGSKPASGPVSRAVGAQYVASLDPSARGMLAEMPRVGAAMLFARADERGRISLVRTGVVTRFEQYRVEEDPFVRVEKAPSMTVETSAPEIPVSSQTPRFSRPTLEPPRALRPEELKAADRRSLPFGVSGSMLHARTGEEEAARAISSGSLDDDATISRENSGWVAKPERRPARPSAISSPIGLPTLRPAPTTTTDDELDPYAARARSSLPPPTPPPRMRSDRVSRPDLAPILDKAAGSRRDR